MASIMGAIQNVIPISLFNRGLASQIFEDVRRSGAKVVMRGEEAECVLLSPEEYSSILEDINDAKLLALAVERVDRQPSPRLLSEEEFDRRFGITEEALTGYEEIELA